MTDRMAPPKPQLTRQTAVELRENGWSWEGIARIYGITVAAVKMIVGDTASLAKPALRKLGRTEMPSTPDGYDICPKCSHHTSAAVAGSCTVILPETLNYCGCDCYTVITGHSLMDEQCGDDGPVHHAPEPADGSGRDDELTVGTRWRLNGMPILL